MIVKLEQATNRHNNSGTPLGCSEGKRFNRKYFTIVLNAVTQSFDNVRLGGSSCGNDRGKHGGDKTNGTSG